MEITVELKDEELIAYIGQMIANREAESPEDALLKLVMKALEDPGVQLAIEALRRQLPKQDDPLAELWDNPKDAEYDDV